MKYTLSILTAIILSIGSVGAADVVTKSPASVAKAESAILTDAVTGQVLYSKNAKVRRPNASTTKIMTAIVVLENAKLDDVVTASERASKVPYTSLHMAKGEQVKVRDLLKALLIRSANDSAVALAEHVGGTVEGFVQMMNDKAKEIGAKDSNFVTPNGLHARDHYSTAHDLALIARYALRNPDFNEIVGTRSCRIERSVKKQDVLVKTSSRFLKNYDGADGVKSGYIKQAGYCFVGSATRGGWRLVSVVLKSPDSQVDTAALMDYGFSKYQRVVLSTPEQTVAKVSISGGEQELKVVPSQLLHVAVKTGDSKEASAEVRLNEHIYAPVKKGDKVGTMTAYVAGHQVTSVDLEAAHDVNETVISAVWPWVRSIGLLSMISIGVVCGRSSAKSPVGGRSRISQEI